MRAGALDARLDHVAVAVHDLDVAVGHWTDTVGGGVVAREHNDRFACAQVRLAGGGKLELLARPKVGGGFVDGFLSRFGPTIHHLTLKVADLGSAIDTVRSGGYDVVDVANTSPWWREGFLRPSQVGGLIVQIAWASEDDDAWARRMGVEPQPASPAAPRLLGVTARHPDLTTATELWSLLGADVDRHGDRLVCHWPDSPLDVVVVRGEVPGPVALRFDREIASAPDAAGMPPAVVT